VSKNIELKDNSSITAKNEKRKEIKKTKQNLPDSKQNKPITVEQKPSLTEFAVDDKSEDDIRLSDIFDEIGSDR
jgi:multidrug efflux pump subunit AcrB